MESSCRRFEMLIILLTRRCLISLSCINEDLAKPVAGIRERIFFFLRLRRLQSGVRWWSGLSGESVQNALNGPLD